MKTNMFRPIFLFAVLMVLFGNQGCRAVTPTMTSTKPSTALPAQDATRETSPTTTQTAPPTQPAPTATSQPSPIPQAEKLDFRTLQKVILAANPITPGELYGYIQDKSLYSSLDGGSHWKVLGQAEIRQIPPLVLNAFLQLETIPVIRSILAPRTNTILLALDPLSPGTFYAVDETAGNLITSNDSGNTWSPLGQLPSLTPGGILAVDPLKSGRLYLVNMGGIFRSDDGGKTWLDSSVGVREPGPSGYMFTQLVFHPQIATTIYLTGLNDYTYVSTNSGASWTEIRLPVFNNFFQGIGGLFLDPQTDQALFAINNFLPPDLRLYQSGNGGQDWIETDLNLPRANLRYLYVDPFESMTRYAILESGELSGLYKSDDGGETWSEIEAVIAP